ncbi:MAG: type II 3-dehydroquinate dehydratase, partial [Actinomycetales bacterium]
MAARTPSILLMQGPNMSYLGRREPHIYGTTTAAELDDRCRAHAAQHGYTLDIFYTHCEGAAIERVYRAETEGVEGIVMNPATFSRNGYGLVTCLRSVPLPYVTYEPGLTVDVLGANDEGQEIIEVSGREAYRDDAGQLRMTTVYVSQPRPDGENNLFELMHDWISDEAAVYPYDAVYREDETVEQNREEGAAQMTTSQDAATAVALEEMGIDVTEPVVADVSEGTPADGALEPGDIILSVDGARVTTSEEVVDAVTAAAAGEEITFTVRRDDVRTRVEVTPEEVDGKPQVGISVGTQVKA